MVDQIWILTPEGLGAVWSSGRVLAIALGILFAALSIALIVASWTRWGQNKPVTVCVVLSILAHVWLLMYAYGTRIIMPGEGPGSGGGRRVPIHVVQIAEPDSDELKQTESTPDNKTSEEAVQDPEPVETPLTTEAVLSKTAEPTPAPESFAKLEMPTLLPPPLQQDAPQPSLPEDSPLPSQSMVITPDLLAIVDSSKVSLNIDERSVALPESLNASLALTSPSVSPVRATNQMTSPRSETSNLQEQKRVSVSPVVRAMDRATVPEAYQMRMSSHRSQIAFQYGGDAETERAVESSLGFLARIQSPNGHWDAAANGAGRETRTLGEDRSGTGAKADTGMTGLALLAFLGAGYTHASGPFTDNVQLGLEYLLNEQMPSGDLAGRKQIGKDKNVHFARMYCHGIACLALAEAFALTGDKRLVPALTKAAEYTIRAQHPRTGGWRYAPYYESEVDDPGDLSQFGWQAMALNSCSYGGFQLPRDVQPRMKTFLDSVAVGANGGLAVYRPIRQVPGQLPTPAMTSEALASRLILGLPLAAPAELEAKRFLISNLPNAKEENLYYWYYATLALYQYQDQDWQTWNQALKSQLVSSQVSAGSALAGSWNPSDAWGGYGGRVYSTAMACMILEVYYRYLPMYQRADLAQSRQNSWSR